MPSVCAKTRSKNELAWLWMSKCVDKKEFKIDCFQKVLEINPSNETAQKALQRIMALDFANQSPETNPTSSTKSISAESSNKQTKEEKNKTFLLNFIVLGITAFCFGLIILFSLPSPIFDSSKRLEYEFVTIPGGEFWMGSGEEKAPVHKVYVNSFEIGKFEVTNAQYERCVAAGKCQPPKLINVESNASRYLDPNYLDSKYANHPVVRVNWIQSGDFCRYINARLPTEAEWEYAARGGLDRNKYPWGNEPPVCNRSVKNSGNFDGTNCPKNTMPVGSYSPNAYGLYDMFGNVSEWTVNWYDAYPGDDPSISEEFGRQFKVMRGGSWFYTYYRTGHVASRYYAIPEFRDFDVGIRCARSISE
jgi:formylglycine-generating enzyme